MEVTGSLSEHGAGERFICASALRIRTLGTPVGGRFSFVMCGAVETNHRCMSHTSLGFHMVIILSRALLTNENGLGRL